MITTSRKIQEVQEYYFATKLREVKSLLNMGKPIINAGIGNPDLPPPPQVVPALIDALQDPRAHGYQSYLGLPELRSSMATFYKDHYGVNLSAVDEIVPLMGSKEGILHISMAFLNPGDAVLVPDPGYPTYSSAAKLCEAQVMPYDLKSVNNWLPDLEKLERLDLSKVKIMWINYPNMPTGAAASLTHLKQLVDFARRNRILIINDNPYSCVGYLDKISIHQVDGKKDNVLELNSISKTFNMAGWRVGMLTGKATLLKEVLKVKTNMDSGMFYAVQKGAIAALQTPVEWLQLQNKDYKNKRDKMTALAKTLGLHPEKQDGGLFIWCKLPDSMIDDKAFVDKLLYDHDIFVAPGSIFGHGGSSYIRLSLCVNDEQIAEMTRRVSKHEIYG